METVEYLATSAERPVLLEIRDSCPGAETTKFPPEYASGMEK